MARMEHHGQHDGHHDHGSHADAFRRLFWWSLVLTVPIVVASPMVADWFGYPVDVPGAGWVGPILGSVVFLWCGRPFLAGARDELRARAPGMMLLIALAITVAYVASLASSIGWFSEDFWWELAALITIMLLGHWQEMKALGQASDALTALAALLPDTADVVDAHGDTRTVALDDLRPGTVVLVRSGARVPADGTVLDGEAEVDESMITGESRAVTKQPGARVVAGTVATDSALRVRVDASAPTPRSPASNGSSPTRRRRTAAPRRSQTARQHCSSTSRSRPRSSRSSRGASAVTSAARSGSPSASSSSAARTRSASRSRSSSRSRPRSVRAPGSS